MFFYDEHLRKQITGSCEIEGTAITVSSADGTKGTGIGGLESRLASLARILVKGIGTQGQRRMRGFE
jgi:hypothetical protein